MNPMYAAYCLATAAVPVIGAAAVRRHWGPDSTRYRTMWSWGVSIAGLLAIPTLLAVVVYGTLVGVVWLSGVETKGELAFMGGPPFFMQSVLYSAFVGCPAALAASVMMVLPPSTFTCKGQFRLRVCAALVLVLLLSGVLFWR